MSDAIKVTLPKGCFEVQYGDAKIQADHDGTVLVPLYVAKALVEAGGACQADLSKVDVGSALEKAEAHELAFFLAANERHMRHPDVRRKLALAMHEVAGAPRVVLL